MAADEDKNDSLMFGLILDELVSSLRNEIAFAVHRQVNTGMIPLSELRTVHRVNGSYDDLKQATDNKADKYDVSKETSANNIPSADSDIYGKIPSKEPKSLVLCEFCCKYIAPGRFSNHLDKCMPSVSTTTHNVKRKFGS